MLKVVENRKYVCINLRACPTKKKVFKNTIQLYLRNMDQLVRSGSGSGSNFQNSGNMYFEKQVKIKSKKILPDKIYQIIY